MKKYFSLSFLFFILSCVDRNNDIHKFQKHSPINYSKPVLFIVYNSNDCDKCLLMMDFVISCWYVKKNIPDENKFILMPEQRNSDEQFYLDKFQWTGLKVVFNDSLFNHNLAVLGEDTASGMVIIAPERGATFHASLQDHTLVETLEAMQ